MRQVFANWDEDKLDALNYEQFEECLHSLGMKFMIEHYKEDIERKLFDGSPDLNRVTCDKFMTFLEQMTTFDYSPD